MIGEMIAKKRAELSLSQEELAEKLCVSRSAVAKWETGKGTPDVENLKALAALFQISVDELLGVELREDEPAVEVSDFAGYKVIPEERSLEAYYSKKCSVELSGWNNGFMDGYIVGEDREFLFYVIPGKKTVEVGAVRKATVVAIREEKERRPVAKEDWPSVDRNFFVGKVGSVWLVDEKLIDWSFREKEFIDVPVLEFSEERVVIVAGKEFKAEKVAEIKVKIATSRV
ncbi:MAG: helix-turn-helix transcriptional regulator [Lachnospiraceae bacterium]|nr:helix-turn-helix transcriptional regulator [Lachnospiraceae bacterium]